jgi:nitrogenase molybdenum-iron protein beta chain
VTHVSDVKDPKSVNLLGIGPGLSKCWSGNIEEITRLLQRIGLRVNTFFTGRGGYRDVLSASRAKANIILSPYLLSAAENIFKKRHGIESFRYPGVPIGPTDTSDFLRKVGAYLGLDPAHTESVIDDEENAFFDYISPAAPRLPAKRLALVGDANTVIGLARFLAEDFSQLPTQIVITDTVREEDADSMRRRLSGFTFLPDPEVRFLNDNYKIKNALMSTDIEMLLASSLEDEIAVEKRIPFQIISHPTGPDIVLNRAYAGYRGALTFVEDYVNANRPVHIPGIPL